MKTKPKQIAFILFYFCASAFSQDKLKPSIQNQIKDSLKIIELKEQLKKSSADQLKIYYELASLYLTKNDSLANSYANTLLTEAQQRENETYEGKALYLKGRAVVSESNFKALDYFNESAKLLEPSKDIDLKDIYYYESRIHTDISEFFEAINLGFQSLEFNKKIDNKENVLRDMSHIGYVYDRMYEFRESIKWNRDALKLALKLNDKAGESYCYGRIGIAYDELAERDNFNKILFDSALYYNQKAAKISEEIGDLGFARTTYSNIGNTYSKLKDYDKAEKFTLKSLAIPGFEDRKGVTLVNLGKIYLETNRFKEARKILDSSLQNTLQYGTRKYRFEAYYRYHELDVKMGNYKSALNNYIKYKSLEDSLLNETKIREIAEIGERYKTAEKERQISIQRAELAEQDLTIQQRNYQLYAVMGFALILGLLGYIFYNQQKLKNRQLRKENELKDALLKIETQNKLQEQRLRISRDLHDNIGAQLTFIISSLDNLKYGFDIEDENLTHKLENISGFASSTIYELRDTIWAMNKSEISFEDLQSRISNYIDKAHLLEDKTSFSFAIDEKVNLNRTFTSVEGMNIYRIIQEAIHNSLKYSRATEIKVEVKQGHNYLKFDIMDNGIGFEFSKVELGNGLSNMKKRAHEIDAKIDIHSKTIGGTTVSVQLPNKNIR